MTSHKQFHRKRFYSKKNPNWFNRGDMFFLREESLAYPAEPDGTFNESIQRVIFVDEPLFYLRCKRKDGKNYHHFTAAELHYVYVGDYRDFTKKDPRAWVHKRI